MNAMHISKSTKFESLNYGVVHDGFTRSWIRIARPEHVSVQQARLWSTKLQKLVIFLEKVPLDFAMIYFYRKIFIRFSLSTV